MAEAGVPLREVARFLAHSDTQMVERHNAHRHPDFQKRATAALQQKLAEDQLAPRLQPRLANGERQKARAANGKNSKISLGFWNWWARQGLNL
jgi:hypothetical protein